VSPRPRTVTDEDIIAAAATVIGWLGPGKLTLAGVDKEIGLSADAGPAIRVEAGPAAGDGQVRGGQGSAAAWVRADVDTVLEPYRLRSPRTSRARQSMRRSLRRAQR
jgi:hypothetical protein